MSTTDHDTAPRYRLRARTQLVVTAGDTPGEHRVLLRLGNRNGRIDPYDGTARQLLHALAEGGDIDTLRTAVLADGQDWTRAERIFHVLRESGFCEVVTGLERLDPRDRARYQRLLEYLSEFESPDADRVDLLERLRSARVAVVGTGGMGSWAIYHLACCGIGTLRLIDGDTVEASNLNRAILYDEADIGEPKVAAAQRTIQRFAPRTTVETVDTFIDSAELLATHLADVDVLVCCADQPTWLIRQWVAQAARARNIPAICASGLRVGPFYQPGRSSCPMCDWLTLRDRNPRIGDLIAAQRLLPKGSSGSLSFVGAMTASMLTWEVFRLLTASGPLLTRNHLWDMAAHGSARLLDLPIHPACPVCAGRPLDGPDASGLPVAAIGWPGTDPVATARETAGNSG